MVMDGSERCIRPASCGVELNPVQPISEPAAMYKGTRAPPGIGTPILPAGGPPAIAAPEFEARARLGRVSVYQRDSAIEPPCSVCVLQLASISTIAPKSLQDSWDRRQ